jgi:UDP-N-acetylglucosamine--N-acetylmuramyl-(pentapeptide) pyrophosphoryl-undecaprenol N-acetylglucosamine transferase
MSLMQSSEKTLLVMAGGTGGHIFPGLAVAEYLRQEGWKIVWLGNPSGMENQIVPGHGIPFEGIHFGGLRGKGLKTKLMLPFNLLRALMESIAILRRVKPSVILGMGGYVTFPAGLAAILMGYPLVLHEQNSVAGLANKVLAKFSGRQLCAFPHALPGGQWVGNPLRADLLKLPNPKDRYSEHTGNLRILVVGGSLGAAALNEAIPKAISLISENSRPVILHQAGAKNAQALQEAYRSLGVSAQVEPFIENMAAAYGEADLVICRAGAMTVAELAASGVASCLVPFPYAVDDHQTSNAKFLSDAGAAVLLPQAELDPEKLSTWISSLTRDDLKEMAIKALACAKPNATADVAQVCKELVAS